MACAYYYQWKWIGYLTGTFITSETLAFCEQFFDDRQNCLADASQNTPFLDLRKHWRCVDLILLTINLSTGDQSEEYIMTFC